MGCSQAAKQPGVLKSSAENVPLRPASKTDVSGSLREGRRPGKSDRTRVPGFLRATSPTAPAQEACEEGSERREPDGHQRDQAEVETEGQTIQRRIDQV